jgi:NAD-dependent SIR2 family protein deacetylase
MYDMEKIIKGLEVVRNAIVDGYIHEPDQAVNAITDAIALLKEQETKIGTWQWKIHGKAESDGTLGEAICDQCGESTYATAVKGDLNYCPNCGAKMRRLKAVK